MNSINTNEKVQRQKAREKVKKEKRKKRAKNMRKIMRVKKTMIRQAYKEVRERERETSLSSISYYSNLSLISKMLFEQRYLFYTFRHPCFNT